MSSPILLTSAIRSSTSEERDGIFGNTQHGNTAKEMKGIGAFAHTGVPTCIHPRNGVQAWQLSGDEGKFGWSQPKPLVLLSETFGCW